MHIDAYWKGQSRGRENKSAGSMGGSRASTPDEYKKKSGVGGDGTGLCLDCENSQNCTLK